MATYYVAPWGNDENDGSSWETAKRNPVSGNANILKGLVNLNLNSTSENYTAVDGGVVDGAGRFQNVTVMNNIQHKNAVFKNYQCMYSKTSTISGKTGFINCVLLNIPTLIYTVANRKILMQNSIVKNTNGFDLDSYFNEGTNSTFFYCDFIIYKGHSKLIIANSNLELEGVNKYINYSLFINSKFKFTGGGLGTDETAYTYPTGATDDDKLTALRNRMVTVYGGDVSLYLIGCKYYSRNAPDGQEEDAGYIDAYKDIFVDADNDDFHLKENNPVNAHHMAWDGNYIGAKPVGNEADLSEFTLTNIDSNGKIIDQETDATAVSTIQDLGKTRKIAQFQVRGQRAARNGQQTNDEANLGVPIAADGVNTITAGKTYMCIDDIIHQDTTNVDRDPWETFIAANTETISTIGSGKVQEVLIDKYDNQFKITCSKTDATLASATEITMLRYEVPMVNVDANGEPTAGNADPSYDAGTAVELYTRYIKYNIRIKANNLPSR